MVEVNWTMDRDMLPLLLLMFGLTIDVEVKHSKWLKAPHSTLEVTKGVTFEASSTLDGGDGGIP